VTRPRDPSDRRPEPPSVDRDQEHERRRLYNLGALAQSYVPRGVVELLKRPASRPEWRARPARERFALYALAVVEAVCAGLLIWGVARSSEALVLAAAAALVTLLLGSAVVAVIAEVRRAKRR
jgi:hypothetical protein